MDEMIELGGLQVRVIRKAVKNVHLTVHPPDGRVTLVSPENTRLEVARAYVISKLGWIRKQQTSFHEQAREAPRKFIERETHFVWGRRYILHVEERDEPPSVRLDHRTLRLTMRPGTNRERRASIIHDWHLGLLREAVRPIVCEWEGRLSVSVSRVFLQKMKTKWGGCKPDTRSIRVNTELVKKPIDLLEYVVVHEMMHLIEPKHSPRFFELMSHHFPAWPEARKELNDLPLSP